MQRFSRLYSDLDASTATRDKLAALVRYLHEVDAADAAWAVYFLAGGKPRQVVPTARLRAWACDAAGVDDWLFEASYQAVGDLAETIAHLLPAPRAEAAAGPEVRLATWVEQRLLPLRRQPPEAQEQAVRAWWAELDWAGRFLLVKLIGGGFRVGVSRQLVVRALAEHAGLDPQVIAQRLMGWSAGLERAVALPSVGASPDASAASGAPAAARHFAALIAATDPERDDGRPYPFFLAHPLSLPADPAAEFGPVSDWLVEWKYDGIRAQLVRRGTGVCLWSRGEELVSDRFPELTTLGAALPPGTVLDGEILAWPQATTPTDPSSPPPSLSPSHPPADPPRPAPFSVLQQRITRTQLSRKLLAEAPVIFMAYDLLEADGQDLRKLPQHERRDRLEALVAARSASTPAPPTALRLSPLVSAHSWPELAAARARSRDLGVEGLMLKHRNALYGSGRTKAGGVWWKWKIEPMTADAVLIYAQRGHGRRAGLYTDYTFAVWSRPPRDAAEAQAVLEAIARRDPPDPDGLQLVAFAKAYSGLSDAEFRRVDRVIQQTTLEKFGPVRSVRPSLVFELGFEGIQPSTRHKSGLAVRFPRMLRIRDDKPLHEADSLPTLQALLHADAEAGVKVTPSRGA